MAEKEKWMQDAVPPSHRGLLTAKARRAGYSNVQEFARQVLATRDRYSTRTVRQANFAVNAAKIAREHARRRKKLRRRR
jgi:hypothetical protein